MATKARLIVVTPEQAFNLGPYIQRRLARGETVACSGERYRYGAEHQVTAPLVLL